MAAYSTYSCIDTNIYIYTPTYQYIWKTEAQHAARTDTAWNAILKRTATRLIIAKCNNQIQFRMNEKEA
jgi:hypothetical protein